MQSSSMTTTVIDSEHRARIPTAAPDERFWVIEDDSGYRLQRIGGAKKSMSREEVLRAIASSSLVFPRDWEEMRPDTREP
jgi:hypothetical protein